jgi:DNA-directed RNA polymerase specialized sigma subunit
VKRNKALKRKRAVIKVPVHELERRFEIYYSRLVRYSAAIIGERLPAFKGEISSDAATDAIIEIGKISDESLEFVTLAVRARSRTLDRLRKKSVNTPLECIREEPMDPADVEGYFREVTRHDISGRYCEELSDEERRIVEAWLEDSSYGSAKAIAETLDIPVSRVYRVLEKFRNDLRARFTVQE